MARPSRSLLALALGVALALALASCGGEGGADLLPGATAAEINSNLDQVEQLASEGDCVGAQDAALEVSAQVEALGGVDAKLKQALGEGAARLNEVVAGCEEATSEEAEPAIETAEEPAPVEKKEKPEKPEKAKPPKAAPAETPGEPALPPQANGEGKGLEDESGEEPASEPGEAEAPSGGVSPGAPVGGE